MRELALDPVGLAAHLVEPGASGGAGGMRAVLAAPAQHMQRLPERGDRHRLAAIIAPGEQVLMVGGDAVQRPQRLVPAAVARHVAQQAADLVRLQRTLVLGLVGRQGAAHRIDGVAVHPQRGHGQLEHPGHAALGLGRDARPVLAGGGGEHVQDVHGRDLLDWQRPDLAENHPLQHVEAARALAFMGRIDALLDEVPRPHALVAGLGQGEATAVADGPRGTGYR